MELQINAILEYQIQPDIEAKKMMYFFDVSEKERKRREEEMNKTKSSGVIRKRS